MTQDELLQLAADLNLSTADRLNLIAILLADLGKPKLRIPGARVIGTPSWTEEEVTGLQTAFQILLTQLQTVPIQFAKPVYDWLHSAIEPFRGNKA